MNAWIWNISHDDGLLDDWLCLCSCGTLSEYHNTWSSPLYRCPLSARRSQLSDGNDDDEAEEEESCEERESDGMTISNMTTVPLSSSESECPDLSDIQPNKSEKIKDKISKLL